MLTGLYKQNNASSYDFRTPSGNLASAEPSKRAKDFFYGTESNEYTVKNKPIMNSAFSIRKVKNFTALKGHIKEHDRALLTQKQH